MAQVRTKPANNSQRSLRAFRATSASATASHGSAPSADRPLDEVESVARIGSYAINIASGRWTSSKGCDAIFGINAGFERSVEGWASLIHPADREAMVAYLIGEVVSRGQPFDRKYRIVRAETGQTHWVHGRGTLSFDPSGRPVRMFGTITDITEQRAAEAKYRGLLEAAPDAMVVVNQGGEIVLLNVQAEKQFGYPRDELLGQPVSNIIPEGFAERLVADDLRSTEDALAQVIGTGIELSARRKDGTEFPIEIMLSPLKNAEGILVTTVIRDISVRRAAVEELRRTSERLKLIYAGVADIIFLLAVEPGGAFRFESVNQAFLATIGMAPEQVVGRRVDEVLPESSHALVLGNYRRAIEERRRVDWEEVAVYPAGTRVGEVNVAPVFDTTGRCTHLIGVVHDVSAYRAAERERIRLGTAVEQSSDAVIVTDLAGTIENVNSAFTRISGYGVDEAIGQNSRILQSGRQSKAFYRALWRRLTRGEVWTGRLTNRRKDGELYEVDATISPIRGPGGEVNGYLGVQRDVTALTAARSALATEFRERAAVSAALSRLQPRGSAEETAAAICDELAGLSGIDIAAIFTFQDPGRGLTLAVAGSDGLPVAPGRPLPAARAEYLYGRASQGPWAEAWRARPEDGAYGGQLTDLGLKATAYAPIRNGEGLLGLVLAGTFDGSFASHLVGHLPIVGEFAATASALLAGQIERGRRVDVVRARITAILATGAFHPVFQPVVELVSGRTVGHEALTRFDDGTRPDEVFADAQAVGLGLEFEAACLAAAITASDALSPDNWLSLNASPDLILEPITLGMLIEGQSRQIILEITEHVAIADYAALRAALAALGPTVSLSVDDAGAGFASLHHVVELSPRFLKLDISLVRNVDGDPTRQAMIAGLAHFAGRTGCVVIAEGIEEPAELAMLRELGVPLGQGYLLGRPEPLPSEPSAQRPRT